MSVFYDVDDSPQCSIDPTKFKIEQECVDAGHEWTIGPNDEFINAL